MKKVTVLAFAASVFLLIGQGCAPAPVLDLPTSPPSQEEAMMKDEGMMKGDDAAMEKDGEAMMKKDEPAMEKDDDAMEKDGEAMMKSELKPYYIAYSGEQAAAAMKEGRGTVLYFWASWCPICRAEEPNVKSWIEGSGLPVAGFRVNYDTEAGLKAKHGIPHQHTAVFLNAKGEEVERFIGPVDQATFLAALKKATS